MSTLTVKRYHRSLVVDGIIGGLIAGVIVDAFLFAAGIMSWPTSYNFIASAVAGKVAMTSPAYVPLGIMLHFVISAVWGALFGLAAQRYRALVVHPSASGLTFGVVVMVAMQLLLAADGIWKAPQSAAQIALSLIAHTVFFGVPIAWYVNRAAQHAASTGRASAMH